MVGAFAGCRAAQRPPRCCCSCQTRPRRTVHLLRPLHSRLRGRTSGGALRLWVSLKIYHYLLTLVFGVGGMQPTPLEIAAVSTCLLHCAAGPYGDLQRGGLEDEAHWRAIMEAQGLDARQLMVCSLTTMHGPVENMGRSAHHIDNRG